jgi:hypothetical protein
MTPVIRRLGRVAVAATLMLVGLVPAASPAAAADPDLPRPTATVQFLSGVSFTGTARLSSPVRRLEIVIDFEGSTTSMVADVAAPGISGTVDLRYVLETPGGSLYPNTDLTARFRATLDDGTFVRGPGVTITYADARFAWRSLHGDLVTVHWVEGDAAFGRRALRIGEESVRSAGDLFGVTESEPIDFFVYPDEASFYDVIGAGARENVGGTALPEIRTLFAKIEPERIDDPWVGVVVPHELTHLVFSSATRNPYHEPLRWLDEGIAVYMAEGFGAGDRTEIDGAIATGTFLPLQAFTDVFPTGQGFGLAYAESVSAVDFLVRRYGQPALVELVRSYAGGVTDDEAFLAALGTDTAGFEAAWLDDLGVPAPRPFGPRDAPAGPVPSDWIGDEPVPGAIPGDSGSPGPLGTAGPDGPAELGDAAPDNEAGLLVVLIVLGVMLAGFGLWLARRDRPVTGRPATLPDRASDPPSASPAELPPDEATEPPDSPPDPRSDSPPDSPPDGGTDPPPGGAPDAGDRVP